MTPQKVYSTGHRNCNYDVLLAHPNDPTKYLQCQGGNEAIKACPDGLVFYASQQGAYVIKLLSVMA